MLIANHHAGRGRAVRVAERLHARLERRGHRVRVVEPRAAEHALDNDQTQPVEDLLVVAGGDGTILHALPVAVRRSLAILPVPVGTENLFARGLGLTADVEQILDTVEHGSPVRFDLGNTGGTCFAVMASIGPDAGLVHRVAATRTGIVSHLSYAGPAIAETLHPNLPPLTVHADGRAIIHEQTGVLVVANLPQYACGLNIARDAQPHDARLDVVFLPSTTGLDAYRWSASCALGIHLDAPGVVCARAEDIRISSSNPSIRYQMDGEPFTAGPEGIRIRCEPDMLTVLAPRAI